VEQPASRAIVYRFDHFRLDKLGHQLQRQDPNGKVAPVLLGARALDVLLALVERSGEIVPKAQIMDTVWSGLAVEEANLTVQISALRRALDRGRRGPSLIRTVRGHGYLLAATVTSVGFSPNVPSPTEQPVGMQVRPYLLRSQHPMVGSPPELPAIAESDEGFLVPRAPERRSVTVVACEILGLAVLSEVAPENWTGC
jgi:DNA-binding winged helix-turn-helix (wHTH) protein